MFTKSSTTDKIKIFLAEDDDLIRNSIQKSISWEKEGFEFVGSAADGELAYPAILDTKPDILITDIKMPFVDGFELSQMVKRELPSVKILILTGYSDFDMTKAAIKTGASEYLLKPVSSSKLLKTLHNIAGQIQTERENRSWYAGKTDPVAEFESAYREMQLFSELISEGRSFSYLLELGKKSGVSLGAQNYKICLFSIMSEENKPKNARLKSEAGKRLKNLEHIMPGIHCFWRAEEGWAFLLMAEDESAIEKLEGQLISRLRAIMDDYKVLRYFGAMGCRVRRLRELSISFSEAEKNFSRRFSGNESRFETADSVVEDIEAEKLENHSWNDIWNSREAIENFLNSGTKEEISDFTQQYFQKVAARNINSALMRRYIIIDIFIAVMSFEQRLQDNGGDQDCRTALQDAVHNVHTREDAEIYMETLLAHALDFRDSREDSRYADIIGRAKELVAANYNKKLSLDEVADQVGMSPSYFSFIFSKETGQTFVAYLTEVRVQKAKEMLENSAMKTSEIGFEVGYREPHYFCTVFKRSEGCSPKEYRFRSRKRQMKAASEMEMKQFG